MEIFWPRCYATGIAMTTILWRTRMGSSSC